ncbi:MAG TPA: transglutaminase family protein [Candidatus Mediterraneibacter norfolkensis]|nr:transglutaminase family protein [Candidatus Mediterraneibacter norfolkensis]
MRKLKFEYSMELKFSSPVSSHYFALRCVPGDSLRQKVRLTECRVSPADYTSALEDGFGNLKLSGCCQAPHDVFGYSVAGTAGTKGMIVQKCPLHPMYRYPSKYTRFEPEVVRFAEKIREECGRESAGTVLEKAVCAMHYLHKYFEYVSGMTDIGTTAAGALKLGKGVCQDYAHIMIAVMRYLGIPARYVNGLMIGEGATHAWVEVYTDGGWYGLDPTNDLHIDEYYISLAHGRDYGDCIVDRGIFLGNTSQEQKIYVNVEEIKDGRDSCVNGTAGG